MAKIEKKQEAQAAAEERDEVLELENQEGGPDVSSVPTPVGSKSAGGTHIERGEGVEPAEETVEAAKDTEAEGAAAAKTTKAGKRSAKAQREVEEETARKAAAQEDKPAPKPKQIQKPNPLKRHGKAYRAAAEMVDRTKLYEIGEAVELAQKTSKVKFDASVEIHINLGVDPRQADQMVRSTVVLPAGTGKQVRVAAFVSSDKLDEAKKAGADIASDGDLIQKIEKGKLDFDVLIATPDKMGELSKVARVLGPRGLMPNPKSGTVTQNVSQAVEQAKAGRVEFRIDKQAIVHLAIGKASFKSEQIEDNAKTIINAILKAKPSAAKGTYVKAISLTTSMGPGIKLDVTKAIAAANPKR